VKHVACSFVSLRCPDVTQGGVEIDASTMKKLVTPFSADKKQQQAMSLQAFAGHDSESDDESQAKP
jgi:hypothetical protein